MDADLGMVVKVSRGKFEGRVGTIVHKTPQKVRLRLKGGGETGLVLKSALDFADDDDASSPVAQNTAPKAAATTAPATGSKPTAPKNERTESATEESSVSPTAYDEPPFYSDSSTVILMSMLMYYAWDSQDQTLSEFGCSPAMLSAVAIFFFTRIFSGPPRVALTGSQWSVANWYIVCASFLTYYLVTVLRSSSSLDNKGVCLHLALSLVAALCLVCYQAIVQGRPERYAAELVSSTVQIMLAAQYVILKGIDTGDKNSLLALLQDTDGNNSVPKTLAAFMVPVVLHAVVTAGLTAWGTIRNTFTAVPGSGW